MGDESDDMSSLDSGHNSKKIFGHPIWHLAFGIWHLAFGIWHLRLRLHVILCIYAFCEEATCS